MLHPTSPASTVQLRDLKINEGFQGREFAVPWNRGLGKFREEAQRQETATAKLLPDM